MQRDERLIVVSREPFNAEMPLSEQVGVTTPAALHYVRNHFAVPRWQRLVIDGRVERALSLGLEELMAMPARSLVVTLECAGNGRAHLDPPAPGEQWRTGAVGTAEWTGVPLRHLLELARVGSEAIEVLFAGADSGTVDGRDLRFERSLPVARALEPEVLVAYAMNGEPLPSDHGAPLRLVVPGQYGMASVKWLARIAAIDRPFRGYYQTERYALDGGPLPAVAPRAVITFPVDGALAAGAVTVRGYCWSGGSPVARVELSDDGGDTWTEAEIEPALSPHAWRRWQLPWTPRAPGDVRIVARAWTADGECQPLGQRRVGSLGYMNNAARPVTLRVGAAT